MPSLRLVTGLLVASLALNGVALLALANVHDTVDTLRDRAPARWEVNQLARDVDALDDALRELRRSTDLVSSSTARVDEQAASCEGVPTRFESAFNRWASNATVTLAYWPTWDMTALDPERRYAAPGAPVANGTVTRVDATHEGGLRFVAHAVLEDTKRYEYRWFVNGTVHEGSRSFRADVYDVLAADSRGGSMRTEGDNVTMSFQSILDTAACEHVERANFVLTFADGTEERVGMTERDRDAGEAWVAVVSKDAYEQATATRVEWHLREGGVLTEELTRPRAAPAPADAA